MTLVFSLLAHWEKNFSLSKRFSTVCFYIADQTFASCRRGNLHRLVRDNEADKRKWIEAKGNLKLVIIVQEISIVCFPCISSFGD